MTELKLAAEALQRRAIESVPCAGLIHDSRRALELAEMAHVFAWAERFSQVARAGVRRDNAIGLAHG